eukprot:1159855-Pelagomonas_calceolata.AAC.4
MLGVCVPARVAAAGGDCCACPCPAARSSNTRSWHFTDAPAWRLPGAVGSLAVGWGTGVGWGKGRMESGPMPNMLPCS